MWSITRRSIISKRNRTIGLWSIDRSIEYDSTRETFLVAPNNVFDARWHLIINRERLTRLRNEILCYVLKVPRKIAARYFPGTVSESQASSESNRGSSHTKAKFLASPLPKQTGGVGPSESQKSRCLDANLKRSWKSPNWRSSIKMKSNAEGRIWKSSHYFCVSRFISI